MKQAALQTRLFWASLGLSLGSGFTAQLLLAFEPQAFAAHWFRNAPVLLAVHLTSLGFVVLMILAVLSQFLPMLLGRALASNLAAAVALAGFFASALLFWCFLAAHRQAWLAGLAGAGILLSLGLFISLAARALAGGAGQALTRATLASSLAYLILLAILGSLMAQGLVRAPLLPQDPGSLIQLHLHLGLFGFAALMIFGVSYELLPMFGLARNFSTLPGWGALILGHLGLGALAAAAFGGAAIFGLAWPALLAVSCLAYALQVGLILKSSLRRQNEPGPWHFRLSLALLLLAAAWGLRLAYSGESAPAAKAAYVYLLLFGFTGGAILSQLQKILPLLSWYDRFSPMAGKAKVPTAAELVDARWAWTAPPLHLAAVILGFGGLASSSTLMLRLSGLAGAGAFASIALLWLGCRRRGHAEGARSPQLAVQP